MTQWIVIMTRNLLCRKNRLTIREYKRSVSVHVIRQQSRSRAFTTELAKLEKTRTQYVPIVASPIIMLV